MPDMIHIEDTVGVDSNRICRVKAQVLLHLPIGGRLGDSALFLAECRRTHAVLGVCEVDSFLALGDAIAGLGLHFRDHIGV